MSSVTAIEATSRFSELLDRVANGEEIVITRHNIPVARIVPEQKNSSEAVREAVEGLFALQKSISDRTGGETLTDEEIRSAIDEGRL